ncbi:alpha-L-fucosidase [Planctomycetota bacterium]
MKTQQMSIRACAIPLILAMMCLSPAKGQGYITHTGGDVDFGKTATSAYTPPIRANMKQLYHDKFGLFVHWGPYAQLEGVWDGRNVAAEWIMNRARIPIPEYEKHAAGLFKPDKFDARQWVDIAESAGMKFIVVTAKHHDGFAMYDSEHPYNLVDYAGFGRDTLKELSAECAKRDMNLGFYYSQSQDWHEKGGFGNGWDFPARIKPQADFDAYFAEKAVMQVKELTSNYGDIFMIWFDTPVQMDETKCRQMMDIVKENQPGALVNSRLGQGYGHFDVSIDNGNTPSVSTETWLPDLKVPWQTHQSVTQGGWGYTRAGGENDRSSEYTDFVYSLCRIVCYGGVYLLNVGPRPDGTIPESQVNSIRAIGKWLEVNGEAIYGADPSPLKFPPFAMTSKPGKLYLHLKDLDQDQVKLTGILSGVTKAYCLADPKKASLLIDQKGADLRITIPEELRQPRITVVVLDIADQTAKVVDETLQQEPDGVITLPVAKCEFATRRISYDYEQQVTHRWGENAKQGLIWTVNVTQPGRFSITTEDTGNDQFIYKLFTDNDTLLLNSKGSSRQPQRREHGGTIQIDRTGVQKIAVYPTVSPGGRGGLGLKGLELIPVEQAVQEQGTTAHYPAFSWDTVPVGFHFAKDGPLMTAEEAEFVASHGSFICLEKGHASRQFRYTEDGIEQEARQLKTFNPDIKVIFYWNTFLDYGMFRAHQDYQQHPEWWLKTVDGTLDFKNRRLKRYDLSHPEVRAWWTDVARKAVVEGSCDGIFLDALPQIKAEGNKTLWGQEKYDAIQRGLANLIKEARTKIGKDRLIFYNGIRSTPSLQIGVDYLEHIDAVMIEHFGHFNSGSKESMLKDIQEMSKAGKHGKIVAFKGWPGFTFIDRAALSKPLEEKRKLAAENITFPLAAFLVGAQEHAYFIYNWGYRMRLGCLEWYPELDKKLGPPLADAKQTDWVLERDFEHASVWIDLENKDARIDWK